MKITKCFAVLVFWCGAIATTASAQLPTPPPYNPITKPPGWNPIFIPPAPELPLKPPGPHHWDPELKKWIRTPPAPPGGDGGLGSGAKGANRRLQAPEGFLGVRGTFLQPIISGGKSWVYGRDDEGHPTSIVIYNKHGVRPTMYFGVEGSGVIADSGLQYEPIKQTELEGAGWTLFQRVNISLYSPAGQKKWEHWKQVYAGNFGALTLTFAVHPDGQISTSGGGQTTGKVQPYWPTNTNWSGVKLRRVIGITQSFTIVDEATMNNAAFSNGHAAKGWKSGNKIVLQPFDGTKTRWMQGSGEYEYAPTSPNGDPRDPGFLIKPYPWMIDFFAPFTRARNNNGSHPKVNASVPHQNRFYNETVNINLLQHPGIWKGNPKQGAKRR